MTGLGNLLILPNTQYSAPGPPTILVCYTLTSTLKNTKRAVGRIAETDKQTHRPASGGKDRVALMEGRNVPADLSPSPTTTSYHRKVTCVSNCAGPLLPDFNPQDWRNTS